MISLWNNRKVEMVVELNAGSVVPFIVEMIVMIPVDMDVMKLAEGVQK